LHSLPEVDQRLVERLHPDLAHPRELEIDDDGDDGDDHQHEADDVKPAAERSAARA